MRSRKCFGDEVISDSGISGWMMNTAVCIGESFDGGAEGAVGKRDGDMKTM
jgi:hypothetical protein